MQPSPETFPIVAGSKPLCRIATDARPDEATAHSARSLQRALKAATGRTIPIAPAGGAAPGEGVILLGRPERDGRVRALLRRSRLPLSRTGRIAKLDATTNGDQGYAIRFVRDGGRDWAVLAGNTDRGTFYAAGELADRVYRRARGAFGVDRRNELAAPAFRYRSLAGTLGGPDFIAPGQLEMSFGLSGGRIDVQAFVDWVAAYKVNHLSVWMFDLMFGLSYPSARYPRAVNPYHANVRHEFFAELLDRARQSHIDVWLFVDFPDNWLGVLKAYPQFAAEGFEASPPHRAGPAWWRRFHRGLPGPEVLDLRRHSAVCASRPAVMRFWRGFWAELLGRYPAVAGIGGQFGEHPDCRCHCRRCEGRYYQQQWEYFRAMVEVAEKVRPGLHYWLYYADGAREIVRHRGELPNLTYIHWGEPRIRPPAGRAQGTRVDWYLSHGWDHTDYEPPLRRHILRSSRLGLAGIQKRMARYHECDRVYFALSEFTWHPRMRWDEFARRYVLRTRRAAAAAEAQAYADDLRRRAPAVRV